MSGLQKFVSELEKHFCLKATLFTVWLLNFLTTLRQSTTSRSKFTGAILRLGLKNLEKSSIISAQTNHFAFAKGIKLFFTSIILHYYRQALCTGYRENWNSV